MLEVGAATDSVTVEASAPLLKSDSAEQSMNLTGDRINALPLDFGSTNGVVGGIRTVLSFMTLSPGVGGDDTNARVNGQLGGTYRIFVDGQDVSNNNSPTSTAGQPSVENVEEFSLQTSNFAAEYGQVAGGMFIFAMRSGTNKFHGSLYEYSTNEMLDASVPFGTFDSKGNALPHAKPKSRKNDYGGLIAGPVWIPKIYDGHNKTFFAFNYEGFRNITSLAGSVKSVPTEAFRNGDLARFWAGLDEFLKSRNAGGDFVEAGGKSGQGKISGGGGGSLRNRAIGEVPCGDNRAGYDSTRGVLNRAGNRASIGLGKSGESEQESNSRQPEEKHRL